MGDPGPGSDAACLVASVQWLDTQAIGACIVPMLEWPTPLKVGGNSMKRVQILAQNDQLAVTCSRIAMEAGRCGSPAWRMIVSATYFAMASDAVAAGEGTLQT